MEFCSHPNGILFSPIGLKNLDFTEIFEVSNQVINQGFNHVINQAIYQGDDLGAFHPQTPRRAYDARPDYPSPIGKPKQFIVLAKQEGNPYHSVKVE